jgi:hypothetical protein
VYKNCHVFRPERTVQNGLALPFYGEIEEWALTRRGAANCYAMPLRGGEKFPILRDVV